MADPVARACRTCGADIATRHPNARSCLPCQQARERQPRSALSAEHATEVRRLAGTMARREIAAQLGVSLTQVNRFLREQGLRSNARDTPADLVHAVCTAYMALGLRKTEELFPGVGVRSIIERDYKRGNFPPRQERWTSAQLLDAARMGGLISHNAQAGYFARPRAYNGSIAALWTKWFRCAPGAIHGLPLQGAWQALQPGTRGTLVRQHVLPGVKVVVLWLDMPGHLRPTLEPWVQDAIATLAQFQAWLWGTHDTDAIRAIIADREERYGYDNRCAHERDDTPRDAVACAATGHGLAADL